MMGDSRLSTWRLAVAMAAPPDRSGYNSWYPAGSGYFTRYWAPVLGPTGVLLVGLLADCYDQAQARHGERVELDPSVIAPAIGVGADQVWRTLTRLDRVSPITLTPSDDGVNVVTLPMAWPPVKGIISAKVDAALASGWVLAVKP
jgi:predicted methyltransferase